MISKYSQYVVPFLGTLCVAGAISIGVAMRAPAKLDITVEEASPYEPHIPQNLELANNIPTMEQVVEKHLFVKERKATGANTFPDLLVKGIYVGSECSVVLSLKSRPEANLRIWQGDIDSVVRQITDPRDLRKPIVDFLNEWDIKEISFKGMTVEHFITGEVETYEVDYTPTKHVKDSAEAGYGQGQLAAASQGGSANKTKKSTPKSTSSAAQGLMMQQLKDMMQQMTPEQRARMADRIRGGDQNQQDDNKQKSDDKKSNQKSSNQKSSNQKSSNQKSR